MVFKSSINPGGSGGAGGTVTSISNSDGTLTIAPVTGDAVASIALSHANAWTGQQNFTAFPITSASNHIAWNLNTAQFAKHTFTENTTLDNPTNLVDGGTYIIKFTQHASAPKTLAYGNKYKWPNGIAPTISNTNSAVDIFTFISDGTNMYGIAQQMFA